MSGGRPTRLGRTAGPISAGLPGISRGRSGSETSGSEETDATSLSGVFFSSLGWPESLLADAAVLLCSTGRSGSGGGPELALSESPGLLPELVPELVLELVSPP